MNRLVLFVCSANVCRSPSMRFHSQAELENLGPSEWEFDDAGTRVRSPSGMCQKSAATMRELDGGKEFADAHRASQLTQEQIAEAAIIITASGQERSDVARLDSTARTRTFTMIELVRLSRLIAARQEPLDGAQTLAGALNSARPFLIGQRKSASSGGWPRSGSVNIPDVHTGQTTSHRQFKRAVPWLAEQVALTLSRRLGDDE